MTENAFYTDGFGVDGIAPKTQNLGPYKLLVPGSYVQRPNSLIIHGTSPDTGAVVVKLSRSSGLEAQEDYYAEAMMHAHAQDVADNVATLIGYGDIPLHLRNAQTQTSFGVHVFPAVVTRLYPWGNLYNHIKLDGTITPQVAADLLLPTAHTLDSLSQNGIVHGDVKPDNLLMDQTPQTKRSIVLVDFGEAVYDNTQTDYIVGGSGYIDPEYARTGIQSVHSNLYGLAATTLFMLKGKEPSVKDTQSTMDTVAVLSDSREYKFALFKNLIGIPNSVAHVFHQAMDRNPENRHPSSVQFLEDVARAASLPERTVVPLSTRKPLATAKK